MTIEVENLDSPYIYAPYVPGDGIFPDKYVVELEVGDRQIEIELEGDIVEEAEERSLREERPAEEIVLELVEQAILNTGETS